MRNVVDKAVELMKYFAEKNSGKIDYIKLLKLIYFSERMHLRDFGRTIVPGEYKGMDYGPVQSQLKDLMSLNSFNDPKDNDLVKKNFDIRRYDMYLKNGRTFSGKEKGIFSESEMMVLEKTWQTFGKFDGWTLVEITHEYPEWKDSKYILENSGSFNMVLSRFFENPDSESLEKIKSFGFEKDPFEQKREVLDYAKEKFNYQQMINLV